MEVHVWDGCVGGSLGRTVAVDGKKVKGDEKYTNVAK